MEIVNLITNPFGIGEKLIQALLKKGEPVYTIYPSPKDVPMSMLGKINFKYGFIRFDQECTIEKVMPRKAVNVYHLYDLYYGPFIKVFTANTSTTLSLLEWSKKAGVKQFIMLSSGEVYGQGHGIRENIGFNPRNFYATTKFQAEILSHFYRQFEIKTIRAFFPFGPGVDGYINRLAESIRTGSPQETEYGAISPTFADDLVEPLIQIRETKIDGPVNICGSPQILNDLIKSIAQVMKKNEIRIKTGNVELTGDSQKARSTLNYQETNIDTALSAAFGA